MAIAQSLFDLFREMTCTHNHVSDVLRSKLHNQKLQKRNVPHRSQGFRLRGEYRLQAGTLPANEKHDRDIFSPHIEFRIACFSLQGNFPNSPEIGGLNSVDFGTKEYRPSNPTWIAAFVRSSGPASNPCPCEFFECCRR